MIDPHLIEEEGLPYVADFGSVPSEGVDEIRVVQINFVHLAQTAYPAGVVAQLCDEAGLFDVEAIIRHTVPAHVERCGDAADIGLEGYASGNDGQQLFQFPSGGHIHAGVLRNVRFECQIHNLLNVYVLIL